MARVRPLPGSEYGVTPPRNSDDSIVLNDLRRKWNPSAGAGLTLNLRRAGLVIALLLGAGALLTSRALLKTPLAGADPVGSFELRDPQGRPVTDRSFQGRPYAVFFGFTHCPELCSATLLRMAALRRALGTDASAIEFLFIGIDPQRDSPAQLGAFAARFDPAIIALGGDPGQVDRVTKRFHVQVRKVPYGDAGDYTLVHTASVFLVDRWGRLADAISTTDDQAAALLRIRRLLVSAR